MLHPTSSSEYLSIGHEMSLLVAVEVMLRYDRLTNLLCACSEVSSMQDTACVSMVGFFNMGSLDVT